MGLFSFLKNAGAKILGRSASDNDASKEERISAIEDIVKSSGIEVSDLSVDLNDDTVTVYGQTSSVSDKEKVILMVGNVEGISTVDDRLSVIAEIESTFHEVKPGDTLSKISKAVYGDAMKYDVIFEANKPMLKHPDKIYPGQMLRIPKL